MIYYDIRSDSYNKYFCDNLCQIRLMEKTLHIHYIPQGKGKMTTYWLIGEKTPKNQEIQSYDTTDYSQSNIVNPSITFQGPDSPASHSLTHSHSPDQNGKENHHKSYELQNEKDRIKHEIATFVAKDLINNIDIAVREFRKSQSANFTSTTKETKAIVNGNAKGMITPTYDKELVISKGKVRDVVKKFNSGVVAENGKTKTKFVKTED